MKQVLLYLGLGWIWSVLLVYNVVGQQDMMVEMSGSKKMGIKHIEQKEKKDNLHNVESDPQILKDLQSDEPFEISTLHQKKPKIDAAEEQDRGEEKFSDVSSKEKPSKVVRSTFTPPSTEGLLYVETFQDDFMSRWVTSSHPEATGSWIKNLTDPDILQGDFGIQMNDTSRFHIIATTLSETVDSAVKKPLIISYEVKFPKDFECGGAYLKLFNNETLQPKNTESNLKSFNKNTPYIMMFGPDICGSTRQIRLILRKQNPLSNEWVEHYLNSPPKVMPHVIPKLYTLIIFPNDTFTISIDQEMIMAGDMKDKFTPPFTPPETINDPTDQKPKDWDDREMIPDPHSEKPDNWNDDAPVMIPDVKAKMPQGWLLDEHKTVPDPNATKPADWDTQENGEWRPPHIPNPRCVTAPGCGPWTPPLIPNPQSRGEWKPPMIPNKNYKGPWVPRQIPNPNYFVDKTPSQLPPFNALGFDLWTVTKGVLFDNVVISRDLDAFLRFANQTSIFRNHLRRLISTKTISTDHQTTIHDQGLLPKLQEYWQNLDLSESRIPFTVLLASLGGLTLFIVLLCSIRKARSAKRKENVQPPNSVASTTQQSEPDSQKNFPPSIDPTQHIAKTVSQIRQTQSKSEYTLTKPVEQEIRRRPCRDA